LFSRQSRRQAIALDDDARTTQRQSEEGTPDLAKGPQAGRGEVIGWARTKGIVGRAEFPMWLDIPTKVGLELMGMRPRV
jgi:hypothetical protein